MCFGRAKMKTFFRKKILLPALILAAITSGCGNVADGGFVVNSGSDWKLAANTADFGTNFIRKVTYGKNKFVAVGDQGKIAYSANGITWTAVPVADNGGIGTNNIYGVAYGDRPAGLFTDGVFVAVASTSGGGQIAYSLNGIIWQAADISKSGLGNIINGVAYGNGKFIAVGADGAMAISGDGKTWTDARQDVFPTTGDYRLQRVSYGGMWVAVGSNPNMGGNAKIAYSTNDGKTWTASDNPITAGIVMCAVYGNGRWVAGRANSNPVFIQTSTDGKTWTAATTAGVFPGSVNSSRVNDVAYGGGKFVAVADGGGYGNVTIGTSTDGLTWKAANIPATAFAAYSYISGVAYGAGRWVAVGRSSSGNTARILYSD
jgi:hypothetical protein